MFDTRCFVREHEKPLVIKLPLTFTFDTLWVHCCRYVAKSCFASDISLHAIKYLHSKSIHFLQPPTAYHDYNAILFNPYLLKYLQMELLIKFHDFTCSDKDIMLLFYRQHTQYHSIIMKHPSISELCLLSVNYLFILFHQIHYSELINNNKVN